jgi:HEAT repeat protein
LEATRGAILARKAAGIPLLIEKLKSQDKQLFQIALGTARELPGDGVADALAAEIARATPERAALSLYALADRPDFAVSPALLALAKQGDKQIRIAAIGVIGRSGDAKSFSTLLELAAQEDQEVSQAAKLALVSLPGKEVNRQLLDQLNAADGKMLVAVLDAVGQRRLPATAQLVKALNNSELKIRSAALRALGETVGQDEVDVLIEQVVSPKSADEAAIAAQALKTACVRMPDREACAAQLAVAMREAPTATKANFVEILGLMGGQKALDTIASAFHSGDEQLQDTASRVLGHWMTIDAGPVLLGMAKSASSGKYQVRALRGYLRLARQFSMSDGQRAEMCQNALEAARRPEERQLVLAILERYPNVETLRVAANAARVPELKADAERVSLAMVQKLTGDTVDARKLLDQIGSKPVKVEIVKAEYGVGEHQKDVTAVVQKYVRNAPLILLASSNYNQSFGGDPAPGTPKKLKIEFQIDGKPGEVILTENELILLPTPTAE